MRAGARAWTPRFWSSAPAPPGWRRLLCDVTVGAFGRYGCRHPIGEIGVFPAIRRLVDGGAEFVDGRTAKFDAVVLATGYRAGIAALFPGCEVPVDGSGLPTQLAGTGELAGVFFVGFDLRQAGGLLRTIAEQALAVAERIEAAPAHARTS